MGCNCGKAARRTRTSAPRQPQGARTMAARTQPTKRFFFATPPAGSAETEKRFTTIYAARAFTRKNPGWVLDTRREPIG